MRNGAADVTGLLLRWGQGDRAAIDELVPLVHQELHRIALRYMAGERPGHTLQPTALVNEAYLRLVQVHRVNWKDRAHFFAMSARVMRRVLVDFARMRRDQKRGGGVSLVTFDENLDVSDETAAGVVALDDALEALARVDERKSRIIELRFFAGLSVEETAEALDVSRDTVLRDWRLAKAWLARELRRTGDPRGAVDES
jgi:RNA polymerase sigma factor (TIGR02999 family)